MHRFVAIVSAVACLSLLADGTAVARTTPLASEDGGEPVDGGVLAVGTRLASGTGVVRLYVDRDDNDTYETRIDEFAPYTVDIQGGVRVAMGDFDGDGNDELVTATGGNTSIKVFEITSDGHHGAQLLAFTGFPQGAQVAAGDLNTDGREELVVGADRGAATVQVRGDPTRLGVPSTVIETFTAHTQSVGVRLAMGNVNASSGNELVTAPGPGAVGRVRVWDDSDFDLAVSDNPVVDSFIPFDASFRNGTSVAVANPDETGPTNVSQILVAPERGPKRVRRWADDDNDGDFSDDGVIEQFFPYGSAYGGGIRLAAGDADIDGTTRHELITAPASAAGTAKVRIIDDDGIDPAVYGGGSLLHAFTAFTGIGQFVAFGQQLTDVYARVGPPLFIQETIINTTARISVPASAGEIRDLDLFLGLESERMQDLDVTLFHVPSNTSVVLFTDIGGNDTGFVGNLDDEAAADIGAAVADPVGATIYGNFNPEGAGAVLSVFDGLDASGEWRLVFTDDTLNALDSILRAWELHFDV